MNPAPLAALRRLTRAALVLMALLALVGCRTTRRARRPLPRPAPLPAKPAPKPAPKPAKKPAPGPKPAAKPKPAPKPPAKAKPAAMPAPKPKPAYAPRRRPRSIVGAVADTVGMYLAERGWDFMDIFGLRVGGGDTFYVRARATKLAIAGFGFFKGKWFGFRRRCAGLWREERKEGGASLAYFTYYKRQPLRGNGFLLGDRFPKQSTPSEPWGCTEIEDSDFHWFDVGAGVGFIAVALDVEVSPREALDFVFGIFCLDICQDDGVYAKPVDARKMLLPAEPEE